MFGQGGRGVSGAVEPSSASESDSASTPVDAKPLSALSIARTRLKTLDFATQQEMGEEGEVGFSARVWAQVSLPYKDPGDVPYWERQNGAVSLTMRPALLRRPDGTRYEAFAYGLLPRHALTWLATEAVRTQNPVLTLGSSMSEFMRKIGLSKGGRDAKRLTDQLQRLFGSQLSVQGLASNEFGHGEATRYFSIADEVQLWFTNRDTDPAGTGGLWSSEVTLSDRFFSSILEAPVPVNLSAMAALGQSPMKQDIYIWATHRVFNLRRPMRIKWADLSYQFGGQYKTVRQFKARFLENLTAVRIVYPELKVDITSEFLILYPSPPHVPPTKRRLELV